MRKAKEWIRFGGNIIGSGGTGFGDGGSALDGDSGTGFGGGGGACNFGTSGNRNRGW